MRDASRARGLVWLASGALLVAALCAVPFALARARFIGVSDDDAARTLIAWDFARAPRIDPTRSSWLPVHSYLLGAALAVTRELALTPRVVSLAGALGAALAALALARRLGATAACATALALAAIAFPWSAFTAWAPGVPEMPCTALALAGVLAATTRDGAPPGLARAITAGALLSLACGHRYEAWAMTAGVVLAAAVAWRRVSPRAVLAMALAAAVVPLAWLAINHARAGNALDFAARVVRYRAAHEALPPFAARLARYPALLAGGAGVTVGAALVLARRVGRAAALPLGGALAVLAWLVATELGGGGATHHVARSLLLTVWLSAPVAAAGLARVAQGAAAETRALVALVALACVVQPALALREVPREVSPDALAAGRAVREAAGAERYLVELGRLDFLWVELGSGAPERAVPDRAFGGPAPDATALLARSTGCGAAVVHSAEARSVLLARGFRARAAHGVWTVLARPAASR